MLPNTRSPDPTTQHLRLTRETLEELVRIETTALETYKDAIRHVGDADNAPDLVDLRREHGVALGKIQNELARLHDLHELPEHGILETTTKTIERIASLFGDGATFKALHAGEDSLAAHLRVLADDEMLMHDARRLIAVELLPNTRRRAEFLDHLT